jgi:hypothetical protein
LKPIELTVPADFEEVKTLLAEISQTSFFGIEPDDMKKSSEQKEWYRIRFYEKAENRTEIVGLLEIIRSKDDLTIVKISERYLSGKETLPKTGSLLTRFVSLFAQNLMLQGIDTFIANQD